LKVVAGIKFVEAPLFQIKRLWILRVGLTKIVKNMYTVGVIPGSSNLRKMPLCLVYGGQLESIIKMAVRIVNVNAGPDDFTFERDRYLWRLWVRQHVTSSGFEVHAHPTDAYTAQIYFEDEKCATLFLLTAPEFVKTYMVEFDIEWTLGYTGPTNTGSPKEQERLRNKERGKSGMKKLLSIVLRQ
jgi:hypothetical protein